MQEPFLVLVLVSSANGVGGSASGACEGLTALIFVTPRTTEKI